MGLAGKKGSGVRDPLDRQQMCEQQRLTPANGGRRATRREDNGMLPGLEGRLGGGQGPREAGGGGASQRLLLEETA